MRPAPALLLLTDTVVTSPDPDCCHSASYAQLLSVLEPISFLERTFRTFCHLFALLCIPAILKSNFMKQSYTRSINNDKQLIVSRVFERLLLSLSTDTWVTFLWHRVTRTWADKVVDTGSGHRGATQCQHLHRYQDKIGFHTDTFCEADSMNNKCWSWASPIWRLRLRPVAAS